MLKQCDFQVLVKQSVVILIWTNNKFDNEKTIKKDK